MMSQRSECRSNIELGSAHDAYMKVWKMKADEPLDKLQNLFTSRWNSGPVWTLIKSVKDNVSGL